MKKQKKFILIILFLILCVAATTIIFMDRIRGYLPSDEGAISLTPDRIENEKENVTEVLPGTDAADSEQDENVKEPEQGSNADSSENAGNQQGNTVYNPGFEASDDNQVWGKSTEVEIFRISYSEDGTEEITIQSANGDNLIAPGSENSYVFKLKNTGDVAMDYELIIDAYVTPADIHIPVEARISRHDQTWVTASGEEFESIPELNGSADKYTLGPGRYSVYTLDWKWPFESGDDSWDTFLGNQAVEQDITLTIKISTTASVSANAGGGMLPQTGDAANATMYIVMMICATFVLFILLFRRDKEEEGEAYE